MDKRIAIYSNHVVLSDHVVPATVLIENGRIVGVLREKLSSTIALPVTDYGDNYIMPGLIDCHVHINEPGRTDWEGFETATQAALAGGITTLVDMPLNSSPVTTSVKALEEKLATSEGKLNVNCGFWGGIVPGNGHELHPLIDAGVMGFKVFLCHSGIDEFPNTTLDELEKAMPLLAEHGLPLLVHAELEKAHAGQKELAEHTHSYPAWLHSRPTSYENEAIGSLIALCRKYSVRTHIVHLSSAEALDMIRAAKAEGLPLTVETCPHYLYFDAETIPRSDTRFKCAPPIRGRANNLLLWEAVCDGTIDFVVSDHSPAPPELKSLESGNLREAWGGIASLQFTLPVMCTLSLQRGIPVERISSWMSTSIAGFLDIKRKGSIVVGADADLLVWNPMKKMKVDPSIIRFRHKVTPYMGEELNGVVEETWVAGIKAYESGTLREEHLGKPILNI